MAGQSRLVGRPTTLNRDARDSTSSGSLSKKSPQKKGRKYGTENLTYPIDMGIDAPAELDNHVIFDIFFLLQLTSICGFQ